MWFLSLSEAILLAALVSVDAFAAAFAYGCKKTKMPPSSICVINLICVSVIATSFWLGAALLPHIPQWLADVLAFAILFAIGLTKLFDSLIKSIIRKYVRTDRRIELSMFNFKFILRIYADPEAADVDISKTITLKEAAVLALALSLDGFAVGFGAALAGINGWLVVMFTFGLGFTALFLGGLLGQKAAHKLRLDISWLAGLVLIALAVSNLL